MMEIPIRIDWKIHTCEKISRIGKIGVLETIPKIHRINGLIPATLFKEEALVQVFSCEFCEISKNTFLQRTPLVAASVKNSFEQRDLDKNWTCAC